MFVLFFYRQFIFKTFLLHIIIGCIKVGEMVSSSNYSPGFDTIFFLFETRSHCLRNCKHAKLGGPMQGGGKLENAE